tara:strand:+ start:2401 stop:2763 length:363 start_codon:yes stop_codon:yes gene_type:complete
MKWTLFGLAGALSFLGASASLDSVLEVKYNSNPSTGLLLRDAARHPFEIRNATTPNLFSRLLHHFDARQTVGRCGADFGNTRCPGNQCCSSYNYCGTDPEYEIPIDALPLHLLTSSDIAV